MKSQVQQIRACKIGHAWSEESGRESSTCPVCGSPPDASVSLAPLPGGFLERFSVSIVIGFLFIVGTALVPWFNAPQLEHHSDWLAVAISNDGHFWTGGQDHVIQEWSPETGKVILRERVDFPIDDLAVSANGERFLAMSRKQKPNRTIEKTTIRYFDRKKHRVLWETTSDSLPGFPQFASGESFVCWQEYPRLLVVEAETGKSFKEFASPQSTHVTAYTISDDRVKCAFATATFDKSTPPQVIILDSNNPTNELIVHPFSSQQPTSNVRALKFSDDGGSLAIAGGCDYVRGEAVIIDAKTGHSMTPFLEMKDNLQAIAWTNLKNEVAVMDNKGGIFYAKFTPDIWESRCIRQAEGQPLRCLFSPHAETWVASGLKTTHWGTGSQVHTLKHASPGMFNPILFLILACLAMTPILFVLPIILITRRRLATRKVKLFEVASRLGLVYSPQTTKQMFNRLIQCSLFQRGCRQSFHDVLQGYQNEREVIGGILTIETRGDRHSTFSNYHLIVFPGAGIGLPQFTLKPENVMTRMVDAVTGTDINFDHSQLASDFSRQFGLKSPDPDAVRRLFDDSLLARLVGSKGCTILNDGGHLTFEHSLSSQSWTQFFTTDEYSIDVDFVVESWQFAAEMASEFRGRVTN